MKLWKTVGCLVLLAVLVVGCVVLGKSTVAAESPEKEQENSGNITPPLTDSANDGNEESEPPESEDNSALVEKTYSQGLSFRSNGDGTCAVAGIGSCSAACILIPPQSPSGDVVTEILPYAFADSIVGAIEIPAGVEIISAASFARCERLSLIRVEGENKSYMEYEGALYTADGKTLVFCPSGRGATQLLLHPNIRRIAADAFSGCSSLKTICFGGSAAEWQALIIGDGNDAVFAASLSFHYKAADGT